MLPKKPTALIIASLEAPVVKSDQIHGDCCMKMYRQKDPPNVATKPSKTTKPTECLTAALSKMSFLSNGSNMQDTQNSVRKRASNMSVPTTPANAKALAAPFGKFASAMHAGIAKIAVTIIDQTGACHLSLTYEKLSGIILSNDIAKNVLEATSRNGGISLATQSTPAIAINHETHCKLNPLAMKDAIPVLHALWKLGIAALAASTAALAELGG